MEKHELKRASAISYKPGDNAPRIIASGKGLVAEKIIDIAKDSKVPIHVDPDCSRLLSFIEIGNEIPADLYDVVAKILVFISDIDKTYQARNN